MPGEGRRLDFENVIPESKNTASQQYTNNLSGIEAAKIADEDNKA